MADKTGDISLTKNQINMKFDTPTSSSTDNNSKESVNDFDNFYKKLVENKEKLNIEIMEKIKTIGYKQDIQDNKVQKVLEELQSIRSEMNGRKRKLGDASSGNSAKKVDNGEVPDPQNNIPSSIPMKHFVMKYTFKNVANIKDKEFTLSNVQEHFGIGWKIRISHTEEHFGCFIRCAEPLETGKKTIEIGYEVTLRSKNCDLNTKTSSDIFGKHDAFGWCKFMNWKDLEENYLIDGNLTVECHIEIKKMTGIYKENLIEFDEKMEDFSDVVLVVNEQKFYVLSKYLAVHSSYFKAMFLGEFNESSRSEIKLSGIDADDFQNYLEVLYGHPAIDDYTVEGILLISDMYDTQISTGKCEEFLLEKSKKTLKKKLEMAIRYNLNKLKVKCLSKLNNMMDVRSVISGNVHEMDPSLTAALLERSITLY